LYLCAAIVLSLLISLHIPLERHPQPVLIAVAGLSVIPLWSAPELLLDSGRYFLQAKSLSVYGPAYFFREWGHAVTAWTDLPLSPFLYGLILKYGNESRTAVQLFNTIVFILTTLLTCRIGTLLWTREVGFYAGLLLTGIPYLLTQVPQMLVDLHAMFFHVLAVYCFLLAIKSTGYPVLALSSLTLVPAALVKFSLWPMLAILPLGSLVVYPGGFTASRLKRIFLILLPAALLLLIIAGLKHDVLAEQAELLLTYQRPALQLWSESLFSTFLFQCHPFITLLALYAVFRAYQLRDRRFLFIFFYCLLIGVLQIHRIRYTLPLLPFITIMAAYGLAAFDEIRLRRLTGCLIVSSSLVILIVGYLPFFSTTSMMNIKKAGETLNNLAGTYAEVAVLPQEKSEGSTFMAIPLLDLFTEKQIISRQEWPRTKPEHLSSFSPLLFTWEQNKPAYYTMDRAGQQPSPLVIISSKPAGTDDYSRFRHTASPEAVHFTGHSGIFRYRTFVTVYH
jgi:hypothetical protein